MRLDDYAAKITDFVASGSFASLRENVQYYKEENYAILVRTADFGSNFRKDLVYTDKHGYDFLSNSNLIGGELILPNIGASIGKVFIVPLLQKPMTLGPNSILIRTYIEEMTKYLYYVFSSSWGCNLLHDISSATAQGKFNKTDLKNIILPIPPIEEQRRIIQSIDLWFAQIDSIDASKDDLSYAIQQTRSKVLDLAIHGKLVPQNNNDEPASTLLARIAPHATPCDTSHYENLPQGWAICRLSDIAKITAGGTPSRKITSYWEGGTIPWLKIADMTASGKYVRTASEYITEEGMKNSSAKLMNKGTLLYTIFASIGEVGILDFDATCNQAIANIDLHMPEMTDYIYYYLKNLQTYMYSISKGCTQQNINQGILKNATIPLPPLAEQKRIVERIETIFASLDTITAEL